MNCKPKRDRCPAVVQDTTYAKKQLPEFSIYEAELFAIVIALNKIPLTQNSHIIICSNSLTLLRSLQNIYTTYPAYIQRKGNT